MVCLSWMSGRALSLQNDWQRIRDLEDIAHNPVLGDVEDRSARIGVDATMVLTCFIPPDVDRAGDSHRHVQLAGARGLAGLPD